MPLIEKKIKLEKIKKKTKKKITIDYVKSHDDTINNKLVKKLILAKNIQ